MAPGLSDDPGPARSPASNRRALGVAIVLVVAILVVGALAGGAGSDPGTATYPPAGATPPPAGAAARAARGEVIRALSAVGIQVEDATRPYRPAESAAFAGAPRLVLRATLPDDPSHGLIVIYEFGTPIAADAAARDQATYVGSGVGRVQFPVDARFVIRVVGSAVVFFSWSPENSTDARVSDVVTGLESVGSGVAVPG